MDLAIREQSIKKVLIVIFFLNLLVAIVKITTGHFYQFLSLTTSGFDSLFDASSNILALITITLAYKPADKKHQYGHLKYENLGALLIALLLIYTAVQLGLEAFQSLEKGRTPEFRWIPLLASAFSSFTNFFVARYEKAQAEKHSSALLLADAQHTTADYWVSFGVIFSILMSFFHWHWVDLVVAFCICGYLVFMAVKIAQTNVSELLDASPGVYQGLKDLIHAIPGIIDCHKFRVRGNQTSLYIDFHILVDERLSLKEAHGLAHLAEDKIREYLKLEVLYVDVTIHVEPYEKNHHD